MKDAAAWRSSVTPSREPAEAGTSNLRRCDSREPAPDAMTLSHAERRLGEFESEYRSDPQGDSPPGLN